MGDSDDPRAILTTGDVSERAAAARALASVGTWEDLELLVSRAKEDLSPSVRLYTAAAAADIACRLRGTYGRPTLDRAQGEQLQTWVKTFDPGINPSLLMLLSAVGDQDAVDRLGRMLRDPRNGVRAGAATALRRMALSAAEVEGEILPAAVERLLRARKLPADAVQELIKLVGEAGWEALVEVATRAEAAVRLADGVLDEAVERLALRERPEAWEGLWLSLGADVLEPVVGDPPVQWRVISDGRMVGPGGETRPLTMERGRARIDGAVWRMVFAPRVGEPGIYPAIQGEMQTWYRVEGKELVSRVDELAEELPPQASGVLADRLAEIDGVGAARSRGIALWKAERLDEALQTFDTLASAKKPRADILWFQGQVRLALGDRAGAKESIAQFLDRAGKRARFRREAEALFAELGG